MLPLRALLAEIVDDALSKGQTMIAETAIDKIRLNPDRVSRVAGLDRRSGPANPLQVSRPRTPTETTLIMKLEKMIDAESGSASRSGAAGALLWAAGS
jgi:hypothetical protein